MFSHTTSDLFCFVHGTLIAVFSFNETEWRHLYISDTVVMASQFEVVDGRLCMDMQMILEVSCILKCVYKFPWSESSVVDFSFR